MGMLYEGFGMIVGNARAAAAGCFFFRKSNCAAAAAASRVRRCSAAADGCRLRTSQVEVDKIHTLSCILYLRMCCYWSSQKCANTILFCCQHAGRQSRKVPHQRCGWRQLCCPPPPVAQLRRPVAELRAPEAGPQLRAAVPRSSFSWTCACA